MLVNWGGQRIREAIGRWHASWRAKSANGCAGRAKRGDGRLVQPAQRDEAAQRAGRRDHSRSERALRRVRQGAQHRAAQRAAAAQ